ncbi:hypothetical protein [Salinarimonas soli]|uniref:Lipoprotein n=1 Tax=Salinarimonas soli TaxID=1638099 RepID=A0A5B2VDP5_9HYPH|nr:hypothetical protein [Salinarimonas soli]KAA2237643.1 hypothetical protein F0L46_08155 [Salinarimonas soli]
MVPDQRDVTMNMTLRAALVAAILPLLGACSLNSALSDYEPLQPNVSIGPEDAPVALSQVGVRPKSGPRRRSSSPASGSGEAADLKASEGKNREAIEADVARNNEVGRKVVNSLCRGC